MYEYSNLETDETGIHGSCESMETALEKVWQSPQWFIRRQEGDHTVLWFMSHLILSRTYYRIHLKPDGNATDEEIDRAMRKDA